MRMCVCEREERERERVGEGLRGEGVSVADVTAYEGWVYATRDIAAGEEIAQHEYFRELSDGDPDGFEAGDGVAVEGATAPAPTAETAETEEGSAAEDDDEDDTAATRSDAEEEKEKGKEEQR